MTSEEGEEDHPEGYYFLAPLLKALLEKYEELLEVKRLAPSLPSQHSPNFIMEFKKYSQTSEWTDGLCMRVGCCLLRYFDFKQFSVAYIFVFISCSASGSSGFVH